MTQLPCIGLSRPLTKVTKPPFGGCTIYFHYGVIRGVGSDVLKQSYEFQAIQLSVDPST